MSATIDERCPFAHSAWHGNASVTDLEVFIAERQLIGSSRIDEAKPVVRCRICKCKGPEGNTVEEAIELWNLRPGAIGP